MIYIPEIPELELVAVYDAGIPNQERVLFVAREKVNLGKYGIIVSWQNPTGFVTPLNEFFWLGDQIVAPPTFIYVYSGKGTPQVGQMGGDKGEPYITTHLGRSSTLFNRPELVPVLVRIDAMNIGKHFDSVTGKFITTVTQPALPAG